MQSSAYKTIIQTTHMVLITKQTFQTLECGKTYIPGIHIYDPSIRPFICWFIHSYIHSITCDMWCRSTTFVKCFSPKTFILKSSIIFAGIASISSAVAHFVCNLHHSRPILYICVLRYIYLQSRFVCLNVKHILRQIKHMLHAN